MSETERQRDERIKLATERHSGRRDDAKLVIQQIQAFSVDGMKAPGLAAAAGVAAALGFYSANYFAAGVGFVQSADVQRYPCVAFWQSFADRHCPRFGLLQPDCLRQSAVFRAI